MHLPVKLLNYSDIYIHFINIRKKQNSLKAIIIINSNVINIKDLEPKLSI